MVVVEERKQVERPKTRQTSARAHRRPVPAKPARTAQVVALAAAVVAAIAVIVIGPLDHRAPADAYAESVEAEPASATVDATVAGDTAESDDTTAANAGADPAGDPATSTTAAPTTAAPATTLPPDAAPKGEGTFSVAPGTGEAVGGGSAIRYRVEVEDGLGVDPSEFAAAVEATLGDPRSWAGSGKYTLQRTDSAGVKFKVVLASGATVDRLCRPMRTNGILSCYNNAKAMINHWRWLAGDDDYGDDVAGYRNYLINHEVGHALGKDHVGCPGSGKPAPLMMQQTKSIGACDPNPWPYP